MAEASATSTPSAVQPVKIQPSAGALALCGYLGAMLRLQEGGVVRKFGFTQPLQPQILLAVQEREALVELLGKATIDDREGPLVARVGLLDMDVEGVIVQRRSVGKGDQLIPHIDTAALQPQCLEVGKGLVIGCAFGA